MAHRVLALRRALILCSLALPAPAGGKGSGEPARNPARTEGARALLAELRSNEPPPEDELVRRIRALGGEAVPELVQAWADVGALDGERRVVLAALRELPSDRATEALRACSEREGESAARISAIRLLALLGARDVLPSWVRVGNELARGMRLMPDGAASLAGSLAHYLASSPAAHQRLHRALPELDAALLPLVARAVGAAAEPQGIDLLEPMLGEDPALDALLLPALARICARHPGEGVRFTLATFAGKLASHDPRVRELAVVALAEARDPQAAELLVERLEDEDAIVRKAALDGLRRLGGPYHSSRPSTWSTWSAAELRWRAERFDALVAILAGGDPTAVVRALGEFTRHPLFAHDIASALEPHLAGAAPGVARAIVQVLAGLRCPSAARALEQARARPEPEVQRAAEAALRALHGGEQLTPHGGLG